jgi:hypothetical protein
MSQEKGVLAVGCDEKENLDPSPVGREGEMLK